MGRWQPLLRDAAGLNASVTLQPFARLLLGSKAKKSAIEKYAQSAMEFIFYGSYTLIGLGVVPNQPWIWPSENWWNVYEKEPVMMG